MYTVYTYTLYYSIYVYYFYWDRDMFFVHHLFYEDAIFFEVCWLSCNHEESH